MTTINNITYSCEVPDLSIFSKISHSELLSNTNVAFNTALCYIPPILEPFQEMRKFLNDPMKRWPPHINLLFPFIPEECFNSAAELLTRKLSSFESFNCTFNGVNCFKKKTSVIWLDQDENSIKKFVELQQIVSELFPYCKDEKRESIFTPHLTIGRCSQNALDNLMKQVEKKWNVLSIPVNEVCMLYRPDKDTCFTIIHRIPLGQNNTLNNVK